MGAKPPWAGRARRAVAEGGYSGRYSEVAGKGCQGHSFEPLNGSAVLSSTGLAKPSGLGEPPLRRQDNSVEVLTLA